MLIIYGCDVNQQDRFGKKPLEYLPLADTVNYQVLKEAATTKKVMEEVPVSKISVVGCPDMASVLRTPGIGDVCYIHDISPAEISESVQIIAI
jgi:hypothetical protein